MADGSIAITEVGCRLLPTRRDDDDVRISVKATVHNGSEDDVYDPYLKGLDKDGFEITEVSLDGHVAPGDTQALTATAFVKTELYKQIVEWRATPI